MILLAVFESANARQQRFAFLRRGVDLQPQLANFFTRRMKLVLERLDVRDPRPQAGNQAILSGSRCLQARNHGSGSRQSRARQLQLPYLRRQTFVFFRRRVHPVLQRFQCRHIRRQLRQCCVLLVQHARVACFPILHLCRQRLELADSRSQSRQLAVFRFLQRLEATVPFAHSPARRLELTAEGREFRNLCSKGLNVQVFGARNLHGVRQFRLQSLDRRILSHDHRFKLDRFLGRCLLFRFRVCRRRLQRANRRHFARQFIVQTGRPVLRRC